MPQGALCPLCPRDPSAWSSAPERPGAWHPQRVVCAAHACDAELPNGRRFADVVRGVPSLDSPGLPYLLNPVRVGGVAAWATFAANGWYLLAEMGDDVFDAVLRSDAYWLDTLWPLAVHAERFDSGPGLAAMHAFSAAAGADALQRVLELARAQHRRDHYRDALRRLGKPCADSIDEAHEIAAEVETRLAAEGEGSVDELLARIRSLAQLARSRLGAIEETWAIDFDCDLPMQALRARLAEHTGWPWLARDSDRLGDYTSSSRAGMLFKIYDEHGSGNGPGYTLALARTIYCASSRAHADEVGKGLITALGGRSPRPGRIGDWR